jgi:hypothetical protein
MAMSYKLETKHGPVIVIDLQGEREWGDCCMCEEYKHLNHCVGYYCGPTHDEIGSVTTEYTDGGIVGGMCVCKSCCQSARKRDPLSACKKDPFGTAV